MEATIINEQTLMIYFKTKLVKIHIIKLFIQLNTLKIKLASYQRNYSIL